jgi:hypothetical protein
MVKESTCKITIFSLKFLMNIEYSKMCGLRIFIDTPKLSSGINDKLPKFWTFLLLLGGIETKILKT